MTEMLARLRQRKLVQWVLDQMFHWLDRTWAEHNGSVAQLLLTPFLPRYKDDPRFAAFCRKVGLPTTTDGKAAP